MVSQTPTWADLRETYHEEHDEAPPEETVALLEHQSGARGRIVEALTPGDTVELRNDDPCVTIVGALPPADAEEREAIEE